MRFIRRLLRAITPHRYATGGSVPMTRLRGDEVPVFISPGRSTRLRPGETHLEAMERLTRGEDL